MLFIDLNGTTRPLLSSTGEQLPIERNLDIIISKIISVIQRSVPSRFSDGVVFEEKYAATLLDSNYVTFWVFVTNDPEVNVFLITRDRHWHVNQVDAFHMMRRIKRKMEYLSQIPLTDPVLHNLSGHLYKKHFCQLFSEQGKPMEYDSCIARIAEDTYKNSFLVLEEQRTRAGKYVVPVYMSREHRVVVVSTGCELVTVVFSTHINTRVVNLDLRCIKYKVDLRIQECRVAFQLISSVQERIEKK